MTATSLPVKGLWFKYAAGVATPVQWDMGVDWNTVCGVVAAAVGAL